MDGMMSQLWALAQVILIDVALAADNAVVVGMAAAGVDPSIRRKVILWGIGAAVVLRIIFALLTTQLMGVVGLTLAGGVLLLWVSWKMWREIAHGGDAEEEAGYQAVEEAAHPGHGGAALASAPRKTFGQAIWQVVIADVSMSLDNVLAVAGAAKDHPNVLILGLLLSVALMGAAATYIANLIHKHPWISWVGLVIILYVAIKMVWEGYGQVICGHAPGPYTCANPDFWMHGPFGALKHAVGL